MLHLYAREAKIINRHFQRGHLYCAIPLPREDWQAAMCETARRQWMVEWQPLESVGKLADLTNRLQAGKYSQAAYNQKK